MEQEACSTAVAEPTADVKPTPRPDPRQKPKKMPPYNVVLLDDQLHTYDYVIEMLRGVFGYNEIKGYLLVKAVDTHGRVIVFQTHKELAELKRDQIVGFGADMRIAASKCGMAATVEPAEAD